MILKLFSVVVLVLMLGGCGVSTFIQERQSNPEEDFLDTLERVTIADLDRGIEIASVAPRDEPVLACYPTLKKYVQMNLQSAGAVGPFSALAKSRRIRGATTGGLPTDLKLSCAALMQDERAFVLKMSAIAGSRGALKLPVGP